MHLTTRPQSDVSCDIVKTKKKEKKRKRHRWKRIVVYASTVPVVSLQTQLYEKKSIMLSWGVQYVGEREKKKQRLALSIR